MDIQVCSAIPGWFPPPQGLPEIKHVYGDLQLKPNSHKEFDIVGPPHWESDNMMKVSVPGYSKQVYVNKKMAPMMVEGFRQCAALGDGYVIKHLGCFAPRPKRSNADPSVHSWAAAFDLNPDQNPALRIKSAADLAKKKCDIPAAWVHIFKSIGFVWGGNFSSFYDPMHFQFCSGY